MLKAVELVEDKKNSTAFFYPNRARYNDKVAVTHRDCLHCVYLICLCCSVYCNNIAYQLKRKRKYSLRTGLSQDESRDG